MWTGKSKKKRPQKWVNKEECSAAGLLGFMFHLSRLTGVAPVRFNGRLVRVSRTLWVVHCVMKTLLFVASIYAVVCDMNVGEKRAIRMHSGSYKYLWIVNAIFVVICVTTAVYTAPIRIQQVIRCLSKVQKIKKYLIHEYNKEYKWLERSKFSMAIVFLTYGVRISLYLVNFWVGFIQSAKEKGTDPLIVLLYFIHQLHYIIMMALEIQFVVILLETYTAFRILNDVLENVSHQHAGSCYQKSEAFTETIHHLAVAHSSLCAVTKTLGKAFETVIILLLISYLLNMIVDTNIFINSFSKTMRSWSLGFPKCLVPFVRTTMLTEPPHLTQFEMDRTRWLVNELFLRSRVVAKELRQFHRHLQLGSATYSPMGICTLGRPLLASMLGTVLTYEVIITKLQGRKL